MLPPRGGLRMKLPRSESLQLHYIWGGKRAEVGYGSSMDWINY